MNNNQNQISTSHRTLWVDACRGIGILLVLLGHNNPPFIRVIYGFHMPLFFILSGYIYKDKHTDLSLGQKIVSILKGYIIPYWIFGILNIILHVVHLKVVAPEVLITREMIIDFLKGLAIVDNMPCCYPMWFLPAFAMTMLVFYLIRKLPWTWARLLSFAIITIITVKYCNQRLPLCIQATIPGILLVEVGYLLKHIDIIEKHILQRPKNEKKGLYTLKVLGIVIDSIVLAAVGIHFNPVDPRVDMSYGSFGNFFFFFLGGIFGSIALISLIILIGTMSTTILKPFAFLGLHTVFFMSFDESTNSWGGTLITKLMGPISPEWYLAFGVRILLMAGYFIIWLILLKIIPPLKKLTHS